MSYGHDKRSVPSSLFNFHGDGSYAIGTVLMQYCIDAIVRKPMAPTRALNRGVLLGAYYAMTLCNDRKQ